MDFFAPFAGSLFALLGTVVVALLGFYQWRKQRQTPNLGAVAQARRKAAESLWAKLEDVNMQLRSRHQVDEISLNSLLKESSATFMRQSLYLDDATQVHIHAYVKALVRASELLASRTSSSAEEWSNTAVMPESPDDTETGAALEDVARWRAKVKRALLSAAGA